MLNESADASPDWYIATSAKEEVWVTERCYITELHNSDLVPDGSLALSRVSPGVTTQLHALKGVQEIYIVLQGSGIVEIDGVKKKLSVGDQAVIAANATQRICNTGTEDLKFYCLCTPRFTPECYENLEDIHDAG